VWRIELYSSWIRRKRIIGAGCNTCENFTIADNYENGFKEQDSLDLFDVLIEKGYKFAMSEFNNPFILE